MVLALEIDLLAFSLFSLTLLILYLVSSYSIEQLSIKLFLMALVSNWLLLSLEIFTAVIDGGTSGVLVFWGNTILLALSVLPSTTWLIYFDFKVTKNEAVLKRRIFLYYIPVLITVSLMVVNLFTGFVFTVDPYHLYTRGSGFYLIALVMLIMPFVAILVFLRLRRDMSVNYLKIVLLFCFLPVLGAALQISFYGLYMIWPSMTLVNFATFMIIEKNSLLKDHLTGIDTRGIFEQSLRSVVNGRKAFTILMFDLNKFKDINDSFGHAEGDEALMLMTGVLQRCIRTTDMLCRYGGDEFMILSLSEDDSTGERIKERFYQELQQANAESGKPYQVESSVGAVHINKGEGVSLQDVLAMVDDQMYDDKKRSRGGS